MGTLAPGIAAIEAAIRSSGATLTGRLDRYGTDADDEPLEAVLTATTATHALYVTAGFTELHAKTWPDERLSGWGFELVLRLADADQTWPLDLLQALARYVFDSRRILIPGDHVPARSLLAGAFPPEQHGANAPIGFLCVEDPVLRGFDGPFGRVELVGLTGILEDEQLAIRNGRLKEVTLRLADKVPLGITRVRPTTLSGPPPAPR
jgi:suppressor of fused-like protein